MIHGIVTLLDPPHFQAVEELWREFERKFGVSWVSRRMPYPHMSFHVAEEYNVAQVEAALSALAADCQPFKVKIAGLGIFMTGDPVLTLTVVRTPELDYLHRRIWGSVEGLAAGVLAYYRPENWLPHITLAQGDLDAIKLPRLVSALTGRRLDWEIMVDNITLMIDDGIKHDIKQRADIGMVH
jgi:2'-5' RNA ligase